MIATHLNKTNELKMDLDEILIKINATLNEIEIQRINGNFDLVAKLTKKLNKHFSIMDEIVREHRELNVSFCTTCYICEFK